MSDHSSHDGKQKLWVGGLPMAATSADLQLHFSQLGEPVMCVVTKKGEGVVVYGSAEEATSASEAFDKSEVGGKAITTVLWSKKMGKGAGSAGGKTGDGKGKGKGKGGWGDSWGGFGGWGPSPMDMLMMSMMDPWGMMKGKGMMGKGMGKGKWDDSWDAQEKKSSGPGAAVVYHKLQLPPASLLVQQGLPSEGPAVEWAKDAPIFTGVQHLCNVLLNGEAMEIEDDPDWEKYPEVGAAWKTAGGEENCVAVAICPSLGIWGVGIANGKKGREASAKLAMAMAVIEKRPPSHQIQQQFPEFLSLCRQTSKRGKAGGVVYASSGNCPVIKGITVPADSKIVLAGCAAEGVAIQHDGKTAKEWFSNAHSVLGEVIENVTEEVEFEDDPDAKSLPEVLQAWKSAGGEDNCFCIAKHTALGVWGAGMASGWKFRESAAKLALAIAAARAKGTLEEIANNGNYPELGEIVCALTEGPATKRRKQ